MSERERNVRRARTSISDRRLIAFFRAAKSAGSPLAVEMINDYLDEGKSLDEIFYGGIDFHFGDECGFRLAVESTGPSAFCIFFSCLAGPLAGDGASWDVVFGPDDQVQSIEQGITWHS